MKTQPFNAYVKKLQYKEILPKEDEEGEPQYLIETSLQEIRRGRCRKFYHNACFYVPKELYDERPLQQNDKIQVKDTAFWMLKNWRLKIYDKNQLQRFDKSKLQKDDKGKTFANISFNAYTLRLKPEDWEIIEKADEICYIQCGKTKFYITEPEIDDENYCFFFDKDTFDKIQDMNLKDVEMNCYLHGNKKWRKLIEVQTAFDEDSGRYFANLIVKEDRS